MKNILILSGSFGGGHNSAANSLLQEIQSRGEYNVKIVDALEYVSHDINKFSIEFYNLASRKFHGISKRMYYDTNSGYMLDLSKFAVKMLSPLIINLFDEFKPSHIICTHPFATVMATYAKKSGRISNDIPVSTIITDYEVHGFWFGFPDYLNHLFVATEQMKNTIIENDIMDKNRVHVTGIPIKEVFKTSISDIKKSELRKELNIPDNKKATIFFAGGALGLSNSSLIDTLNTLSTSLSDYHFIVITGKNEELYNNYKKYVEENNLNNITLIKFADNVNELMDISDFIVSKPGGLTTSEAIAKGVTLLIINPLPGQEEANTKYIVSNNAGVHITKENIHEITNKIKNDPNYIKNMKINSKKIGKPYASNEIIDIVLNDLI